MRRFAPAIAAAALMTSFVAAFPSRSFAQTATTVPASLGATWDAIALAENARAATPAQLRTLIDASRHSSATIRGIGVRALGRLQRPELTDTIARALTDRVPSVRAHAAAAIALANVGSRTPQHAREVVENALASERDPAVIGALAEALGRFRNADAAGTRMTAAVLIQYENRGTAARLGVIRGLHFLARQQPATLRAGLDTARATLLRAATAAPTTSVHSRRLAVESLALAGFGSDTLVARILKDPDAVVRRDAMLMAALPERDTAVARRIAMRGLADPHWRVRHEALRQLGARVGPATSCDVIMPHARDTNISPHVRLIAIDLLGARCIPTPQTVQYLDSVVRALPRTASGASGASAASGASVAWHAPAHALVSLAARDPAAARAATPAFASHPNLFVRTYAATAAAVTKDTAALTTLARDAHPNVRTAAVQGLSRLTRHASDAIYLEQLSLDDGQLMMEAAAALDSTTMSGVGARVLDALDRVTRLRTENSRDGRVALINILPSVGDASLSARLAPYLADFDTAVAYRAAAVLNGWGASAVARPVPLPPEAMPTYAQLARLARTEMIVEMENGLVFEVRLLPFDAPTNAARFARLARAGYFNGLTLHRVEPNFVVQGGSQSANEYAGDPRFSRDEIGYPNYRGTIGLSTRGHDTGDAQIFINVIDNTQLDPLYTVFAEVVVGMSNVDRILEGDAIRNITLR